MMIDISLHEVLLELFPEAAPGSWTVESSLDTGMVPVIVDWNLPYPQPTPEQIDTAILAIAKKRVYALIQEEKKRVRDSGIVVDGIKYDTDLNARTSYANLKNEFRDDPSLTKRWRASDGVWVDLTATMFNALYTAVNDHADYCFYWQESKEKLVVAAKSIEELSAIDVVYTG